MHEALLARRRLGWPTGVGLIVAFLGPPALAATMLRACGDHPTLGAEVVAQLVLCGLGGIVLVVVTSAPFTTVP